MTGKELREVLKRVRILKGKVGRGSTRSERQARYNRAIDEAIQAIRDYYLEQHDDNG